ncbi:MAG: C4-type zinc ribbon domain-containing protein [Acidobacteriota bacterium]|nr:C4-type zinc ribbon domain-containing protein [Acidobacteriota bacterium]
MHPEIEKLIELQGLESRIRHAGGRLRQLPREIAAMEEQLGATRSLLDRQQAELDRIAAERRQLEGEIQIVEDRISKYRSQLSDVKTNEQYKALLHEIDFHGERIGKMEDEILLNMEKEEGLREERLLLEQQLQKESAEVDREKQAVQKEIEETQIELDRHQREAGALIALIAPEVYGIYRKIATVRKGVALARAEENCQGCHVRIRPSVLGQVMAGNLIVHCDSCDRFLYWEPDASPASN